MGNSNGVSTFLWDTTFTTTYDIVNREIREQSTYPKTFDNTVNTYELLDYLSEGNEQSYYRLLKANFDAGSSTALHGDWGQWQLDLRGNGNSVFMKLPVMQGTITQGGNTGDLSGGYLIVMVKLRFDSRKNDITEKRNLALGSTDSSQVSVIDHSFPKLDPESDLEDLVEGAFKRYLNKEKVLEQFYYVFSTVDINSKATGDFAWLKPSDTGYAVFVPEYNPKEEDGLFSILCMTENRKAPPYIQQSVDSQVFAGKTEGTNAVLCISPQKFCEKLLITAAMKMIVGTVREDYDFSADGQEIHNVREITFKNVEVADKKQVDLKIAALNFSIQLKNDHLDLKIIDASYSTAMYNAYLNLDQRIEFETKKDGNKTIFTLKKGDEFKGNIHAIVEPSDTAQILKWVGVAIDILSAVMVIGGGVIKGIAKCVTTATSAAASVTDAAVSAGEVSAATAAAVSGISAGSGAAKAVMVADRLIVIGGLCAALGAPFSMVELIAEEAGKDVFDHAPSLEDFADNFLSEIAWTGINKTTLVGARLNDALLMDFRMEE